MRAGPDRRAAQAPITSITLCRLQIDWGGVNGGHSTIRDLLARWGQVAVLLKRRSFATESEMSFIYAGVHSVVALTILGVLAATEGLIQEMRDREILPPRPVPIPRPQRRRYAHAQQRHG